MSDGHDYLLDALDSLTRPKRVRFIEWQEDGSTVMHTSTHDSLLVMLERAKAGGIGSHDSGPADGPKWPINSGALMLFTGIEQTAAEWFRSLSDEPSHADPATNLRQWFILWRAAHGNQPGDVEEERHATRVLGGWAYRIESMFDPPNRLELTGRKEVPVAHRITGELLRRPDGSVRTRWATVPAECPVCHESSAFDPSTGDKITALGVTYRKSDGADLIAKTVGMCASCGETWVGQERLEELGRAIGAIPPPKVGVPV